MEFFRKREFYWYRLSINLIILTSFLLSQVVYAGALEETGAIDNKTKEELEREGFIGDEYIKKLQNREAFLNQKMQEIKEIRGNSSNLGTNLLKQIEESYQVSKDIKQQNDFQNQKNIQDLRNTSDKNASLVASYGRHYIKYGDGKKVWMYNGLVTDVENEVIYDKHGNKSMRNTRNMQYDSLYQLKSYESETQDAFGNKTSVKWGMG
ncbi:MAG: hypothetical protein ACD_79C01391G0001, partial [uncultured bacterium]